MIEIEKLSVFNIDIFREFYDKKYNSLTADKSFFEYYDSEVFIIKYYLRKQVHLFKYNNKYIGYIWNEYPIPKKRKCDIFALYINNQYSNLFDISVFSKIGISRFKLSTISTSSVEDVLKKLNCNYEHTTYVMKIECNNEAFSPNYSNNISFKIFERDKDEQLRCTIQNAIFNKAGRIPLTPVDIIYEENEEYYINDFSIFIKYKNNYIGYGQIIKNGGVYTIVNLGIIPSYRGLGFGNDIIKHLIYVCITNKIKEIYIKVDKDNCEAYNLYRKLGFVLEKSYSFWSL